MVDLDHIDPPAEVLGLIPRALAAKLSVLPLAEEGGSLVCAVPEGEDRKIVADLEFATGRSIRPTPVHQESLVRAVARLYSDALADLPGHAKVVETSSAWGGDVRSTSSSEGSAVSLANSLIADAVRVGASDIHVEPYETFVRVRFRLDGVLQEVSHPSVAAGRTLVSRLKIMADLDIAEKRRPQDGRIRVKEEGRTIDIRVSTLPTDFGEKVVLRILDKSRLELDLGKLGFEEEDLKAFQKALKLPHGMILVTGPTGSGKTTTLYAALNYISHSGINITTIEDPIEYNLAGINQTHVRADIGLTFAAALRSILRQDPNVIMVGEIRDTETAEIAIRAALTGHLVLSTLHTNDAPSAITRLQDMGVDRFLIQASLRLVLAQRLLRVLCPHCRLPEADGEESVGTYKSESLPERARVFRPGGCPSCRHTGYSGRSAVYELLVPTQDSPGGRAIEGVSGSSMRQAGRETRHRTLREAAFIKARRGETSMEEVQRLAM